MVDRDDRRTNPSTAPCFAKVIEQRINRRQFLRGSAVALFAAALPSVPAMANSVLSNKAATSNELAFTALNHDLTPQSQLVKGYSEQILLRWGDALFENAPSFNPAQQTPAAQQKQFGYNNDYIAYMPLEGSTRGLLCVNHEYPSSHIMFSGQRYKTRQKTMTAELARIEMAAVGQSIVEIALVDNQWQVIQNSRYNRRIDALETVFSVSGAAAGHNRLKTPSDPTGKRIIGMMGNCAGGVTPWGTVLTCEENFHYYFTGKNPAEAENNARYGVEEDDGTYIWWAKADPRFDLSKEPNGANRYGWVIEVDPYDPHSTPVKRTSLGRFKHETATCVLNNDGRVVVYSGDDQVSEFIYKYVSNDKVDTHNRANNSTLLDNGTLYVAKFESNGTLIWLPLVFGQGALIADNRFYSQADVCIEARRAATLMGATPMDRPEGIAVSPTTGKVYISLTKNAKRYFHTDAANPRSLNFHGHLLEITSPNSNHAATTQTWDIFLLAGNPEQTASRAHYQDNKMPESWFSCPDNLAFDPRGNLWIATDGAQKASKIADGLYACATEGTERALPKLFYAVPKGAEATGPCFTPDGKTLFVSVQHPAEKSDSVEAAQHRWPDFNPALPPRPSVVALRKQDGGMIGS